MKLKIMLCCKCEDKWFMDDNYEHTNPEVSHCENCAASGNVIKYIVVDYK